MFIKLKNKGGEKLLTGGTLCEKDITVVPKLQNKTITANGTYTADNDFMALESVTVNVESGITIPDGYIKPSGTKPITTNGTHDVRAFESVDVNVPTGGGSSGGDCTGTHINVVDELPEVGVEGAYYGLKKLIDVYVVMGEESVLFGKFYTENGYTTGFATATTTTISKIDNATYAFWYLTDIPDIYFAVIGEPENAEPLSSQLGGGSFIGEITDISQATEDGYYAYIGIVLYQYTNGEFKALMAKGDLQYTSNGDGTCYVSGLGENNDTEIVIPSTSPDGDTVTAIGEKAFQSRLFTDITIPDSVTGIGEYAFSDCRALSDIIIPDGVCISHAAFSGCRALTDITIPDGVTEIASYLFYECYSLISITIPDSVTSIGASAFYNCNSLSVMTIPSGVTSIGDNAFHSCSLYRVTIPDGVTEIKNQTFANCTNLSFVTFGNGVTKINNSAFYNCRALHELTLPASLTEIDSSGFSGCIHLMNITFSGTMEQFRAITLGAGWNENVPATKVTCSDGEVAL